MDEKLIKEEQDQPVAEKRVYTPPAVTQYGKLTELTASGSNSMTENNNANPPHGPMA